MSIPTVPGDYELSAYFVEQGLTAVVDQSDGEDPSVNEMILSKPYKPNLSDLYRLHRFVIDNKRTTILEFGTGWSTMVFAHALVQNQNAYAKQVAELRRNNPFEVHSVDNEEAFIKVASDRLSPPLKERAHFHFSPVRMTYFLNRYATEYHTLPLINPDFIYLDGPDQFNLTNEIGGFTTAHKDMMPMACDILKIEHFLTPGTIIVVDGRAANARFIKCNLQREWIYEYSADYDQHVFLLNELPLGKYNQQQLAFYEAGAGV